MRLDTITRIERFIQDSLLSSPQIPLGVNIVRLAADYDTEGIAAMARSIVVRYVGSDASTIREVPLVLRRTLTFELTHSAQSYLSQSGHDFAVQMCAGAQLTLSNSTPMNTGAQVVLPFYLSNERFEGLTDSTHYVYVQTWQCQVEELFPAPAIDPCVMRGNCSFLFPSYAVSNVLPGDVLYTNVLYAPVLPPPAGVDYDPALCGVEVIGDDLFFTKNRSEMFLKDWMNYTLITTNTFDTTGELLKVNIYDENGEFVKWYFAANCGNRRVIQIAGDMPNSANNLGGLWRSPVGQSGNVITSSGPETLRAVNQAKNGYGYVSVPATLVFEDPADPDAETSQVQYGTVHPTLEGVIKEVDGVQFYRIGSTRIGIAWIRTIDFTIIKYDPRVPCEEDQISDDGVPPGEGTPGKIDSCD